MWRCGNRGSVASVLIEKPACGDFLPILDGGFSLQYSPLLEYRQGRGMILFCQMDVTGRTENDPAATHLVGNMLRYVNHWKAEEKRKVMPISEEGDDGTTEYLEKIGVVFGPAVMEGVSMDLTFGGVSILSYDFTTKIETPVLVLGPGCIPLNHTDRQAEFREMLRTEGGVLIGLNQEEMEFAFPELTVKNGEHISTYFEPLSMNSPLRGIGPADVHNRDP